MLQQKIVDDLKEALKTGDSFRTGVLRMLLSSLHNREIEKKSRELKPDLSEEEVVETLTKESKKRKEAIDAYLKGNRDDLVQKETKELEIIKRYLPEELGKEEVEKIVAAAIEKTSAKETKDFGRVMGEAMKELKGRAEASVVSEIIKRRLQ